MSSFATIRRYYLIYEKVSQGRRPTFAQIHSTLVDHGFEISERTLQRDIERLRRDFSIEILYDKTTNGYYIDDENTIKPDVFMRFLDIVGTAEVLSESLKNSKDTLRFLHFEAQGYFQGSAFIPIVLTAIQKKKYISYKHKGFHATKAKEWMLAPYLLKEYQNRWYVIGIPQGSDAFLSFGLDRIRDLKMTTKGFKRDKEGPEALLENTIGLTWSVSELQEVIFSITKPQDKYTKTLPLHHSQEVVEEDDKKTVFRIYVHPNYELMQKLLSQGWRLTVLKPEKLANDIKEEFEKSLKNYAGKKSNKKK